MANAQIKYERSEYVNDARLVGILTFVARQYESDSVKVVKYRRNPHLEHTCDDYCANDQTTTRWGEQTCRTLAFDVRAMCHPSCRWEALADVRYRGEWQTLVAQATCGHLGVWCD